MFSAKLKSLDFYRRGNSPPSHGPSVPLMGFCVSDGKIPKDLTEASLSGAGLSILAALFMMFLFGMELSNFLSLSTSTSIVVDNSADSDLLNIVFNISFPALSCEFASVDVSDVLGTNRLNITNTIYMQHIDHQLSSAGELFESKRLSHDIKHGDEVDEEIDEGSVPLTAANFDKFSHRHQILVVNFYAPWCVWSNRLKPSWEKAATIMRERYDPYKDTRILLAKVDCTVEKELCKRHHIQGYPSIRIFRKGNNLRSLKTTLLDECISHFASSEMRKDHGHHEHESYYGNRDTDSLANAMQALVSPIALESQKLDSENKSSHADAEVKRPAPLAGGCRIVGHVRVKMVPGDLIISARSGAHSFDTSQMNMSHVIANFMFGPKFERSTFGEAIRLVPDFGKYHDRLQDRSFINGPTIGQNVTIEHYLQVVKREVVNAHGHSVLSEYEYTAHSSLVESIDMPVAKFHFELSPMQVLITEDRKSLSHFITNICAIIGGVFTVAGILDSIFHNTVRLMKKIELGKNL